MTNPQTYNLEFRWTVSRGRDTYGYNICSLYVDGIKVSSCKGGGYDMEGTALGDFISDAYQDRLQNIRDKTHRYTDDRRTEPGTLYGLSVVLGKMHIDGACGILSVIRIMRSIGLELEWVKDRGKNQKHRYTMFVDREEEV